MPRPRQTVNIKQYAQGWAAWGLASTAVDGGLCVTLNLLDWADLVQFGYLPGPGDWLATSMGLATLGGVPLLTKAAIVMIDAVNLNPARLIENRARARAARQSMLKARQRMAGHVTPAPKPKPKANPVGQLGRAVKFNGKPVMLNVAQALDGILKGPTSHGGNVDSMFEGFDDGPKATLTWDESPAIEPRWYCYLDKDQRTPVTVLKSSMSQFLWWGYDRQIDGSITHPWSRNEFEAARLGKQRHYHAMTRMLGSIGMFEGRGQGASGILLIHPRPALSRLEQAFAYFDELHLYGGVL